MELKGIGASRGIAIAKVFRILEDEIEIPKNSLGVEKETENFKKTCEKILNELKEIEKKLLISKPEEAAIFQAHQDIASDPVMQEEIIDLIKNNKSAMQAVDEVYQRYSELFESMDDEYMRERASDIKDIKKKMLYSLAGKEILDLSKINQEVIIVAHDLTPSQTVQLNKKYVKGFATNIGGATSHSAIMARSLNIPSVVGLKNILEMTKDGDILAIDGMGESVVINPDQKTLKIYEEKLLKHQEFLKILQNFKNKPSLTKDGHKVEIAANIGSPKDMEDVIENDAEAVGLFRSEFLYMDNSNWPSEEEQFQEYAKTIKAFKDKNKKTIIRTLDIGGDKTLNYFAFPKELNPFLGYRAIRFTLEHEQIFKDQIRAIIRASFFGKVGVMFPMITNVDEFLKAKEMFEKEYQLLKDEKQEIGKREDIELGLMIETPAAAVLSDKFSKYADFLSIGTNDLIQYSMAADRMNEKISYLYQPLNPSILKLIKLTIDGGHKHGKWVGMCGEMAGNPEAIPVLLGLGLDEFSMSASNVLQSRELISRLSYQQMKELAQKALECEREQEVKELYKNIK
ncbi:PHOSPHOENOLPYRUVATE-PROTEIN PHOSPHOTRANSFERASE (PHOSPHOTRANSFERASE SYSTEM, ENZYME I) [Mycoplasmopsis pulmonis]|uniref:Phosphoenolpyruvate-protein phosphotransferase n=1 Tax=Mycoplasmopsis pulmonis (strain UAB CTIP) TaxID=272635 RepID=Q98PW7_MYCPU|nr:phosphoenolpyruvate--protein phosphotransferase [Mycoplasmopsis pulmonis]MDZ7293597.1 phosphoenolpyruvate--protein phosphotransferase [Mycoplasmopsis pulmonis]CAC13775.1 PHOSPHOENOLPYRUVATE-PROTEIN PHOSPHOTRANSFERASE (PHOSPHOTRANSFERASE SYSTEM, ENZYME I) [Mycoplasmopsis pulmonis]VEU68363.1 Phosphoenolpyruvate-protein phosphotransferase [Mycoplasmopsis pulmonis]